ncbi:MAG: shikimate kinase [Persephonella sp.]|nr:MAG: shikimate kinase [Persephonella sp.]RUM61492.1 MAG: shikimate kinase [Persephonella sp.]
MRIYLIGFMGSGKSSVGKLLADRLGYRFIDTDLEIEKDTGLKIRDIFKIYGEDYFRDLEKKKIKELSSLDNVVIATGGGLPANKENLKVMKDTGKVVWLNIDFNTFLDRVSGDENRPLLKEDIDKLKIRFEDRKKFYSQANIKVSNDNSVSIEEVVERIIKELKE